MHLSKVSQPGHHSSCQCQSVANTQSVMIVFPAAMAFGCMDVLAALNARSSDQFFTEPVARRPHGKKRDKEDKVQESLSGSSMALGKRIKLDTNVNCTSDPYLAGAPSIRRPGPEFSCIEPFSIAMHTFHRDNAKNCHAADGRTRPVFYSRRENGQAAD